MATVGFVGWDLLESRAAHRERAASAVAGWTAPLPLAVTGPAPRVRSRLDTDRSFQRFDPFHPLNSILVAEEPSRRAGQLRPRFDVPAVWGGP